MPHNRGAVVKLLAKRLDPDQKEKERYAVVLSKREYNDSHDHGIFVMIGTNPPYGPVMGAYEIADLQRTGLEHPSFVVPWLWTMKWTKVIRPTGELPQSEFQRMIERLREVVTI